LTEQQRHVEAGRSGLPSRTARLTHFLIGKSIAEALFVAALAVCFTFQSFNPYFRGTLDVTDAESSTTQTPTLSESATSSVPRK